MKTNKIMKNQLDKEQILSLLKENEVQLRKFGVKKICLFGSFVRNEQHDESDLDFLIEFEQGNKTFRNFVNLAYYLEELFNKKVEIVTTGALSPYIGLFDIDYIKHIHDEAAYYDIVWDVINTEIPKLLKITTKIIKKEK